MNTEHFKEKLEAEKEALEKQMQGMGRRNPNVPDDWEAVSPAMDTESDVVDQADVIVNRENNAAVLDDLEARYDSILATLTRIEKGSFGRCNVCGEEIERARLEANPAATTCAEHRG